MNINLHSPEQNFFARLPHVARLRSSPAAQVLLELTDRLVRLELELRHVQFKPSVVNIELYRALALYDRCHRLRRFGFNKYLYCAAEERVLAYRHSSLRHESSWKVMSGLASERKDDKIRLTLGEKTL